MKSEISEEQKKNNDTHDPLRDIQLTNTITSKWIGLWKNAEFANKYMKFLHELQDEANIPKSPWTPQQGSGVNSQRDGYAPRVFVLGGVFITQEMHVALTMWGGLGAVDEKSLYNLVRLMSAQNDIDVRLHVFIMKKLAGDPQHKDAVVAILESYKELFGRDTYIQGLYTNIAGFGQTVSGGIIKALLAAARVAYRFPLPTNDADDAQKYPLGRGMQTKFSGWIEALYGKVSPYHKLEDLGQAKEYCTAEPLFDGEHDFIDRVLQLVYGEVHGISPLTYGRQIREWGRANEEANYKLYREAQQLDYYYAGLVRGASVRMNMDRVWTSTDQPAPALMDNKKFVDVVWAIVKKLQPAWAISGKMGALRREPTSESAGRQMLSIVQHMKDVRNAMVEIWTESASFRVSDTVHMVEVQILQRLKRDGLISWFDEPGSGTFLETLEVCNWFRYVPQHACFFFIAS
jgi:hypothetical protein